MRLVIVLFCVLAGLGGYAQAVRPLFPPPSLGLTCYNSRISDPFSIDANIASVANVEEALASVCSERKFLQADFNYFFAATAFPFETGGAGVSLGYAPIEGYRQSRIGVSYARKLGARLSLGIQFNYHRISITGYGSGSSVTAALAARYNITDKIALGFGVDNPAGGRLGKVSGEKLAAAYHGGIGNRVSDKVFVLASLKKVEDEPVKCWVQLQYETSKLFRLLGGVCVNSGEAFTGLAITVRQMEIEQVISWNQALGISPALVIIFHAKKKE